MNVIDRFIEYCKIETTSCEDTGKCPSTDTQFTLAQKLVEELKSIGVDEVSMSEHCYVYAKI
ncbi:MAG: peptidase T, partial [Clostridia bacterium]